MVTPNTSAVELDWSLPARLRRIAQVFGDAIHFEAANRIEELEAKLSAPSHVALMPLSDENKASRMPLPVEVLAGALQDKIETTPSTTRLKCCMDGQPLRVDPCASCPENPHQVFRAWIDSYGLKSQYDRSDMAACWYAGKRSAVSATPCSRELTHHEQEVEKHFERLVQFYAGKDFRTDTSNDIANTINDAINLAAGVKRLRAADGSVKAP